MHARYGDPHRSYVDYPTAVLRTLDQKLDLSQHVCIRMRSLLSMYSFLGFLPIAMYVWSTSTLPPYNIPGPLV